MGNLLSSRAAGRGSEPRSVWLQSHHGGPGSHLGGRLGGQRQRPGPRKCHVAEPPLPDPLCPSLPGPRGAGLALGAESGQRRAPQLPDAWRWGELAAEGSALQGVVRGCGGGGKKGWLSKQPAHPSLRAEMPGGSGVIKTRCPPALRPGSEPGMDTRWLLGPRSLVPTWPGLEPTRGWGWPPHVHGQVARVGV